MSNIQATFLLITSTLGLSVVVHHVHEFLQKKDLRNLGLALFILTMNLMSISMMLIGTRFGLLPERNSGYEPLMVFFSISSGVGMFTQPFFAHTMFPYRWTHKATKILLLMVIIFIAVKLSPMVVKNPNILLYVYAAHLLPLLYCLALTFYYMHHIPPQVYKDSRDKRFVSILFFSLVVALPLFAVIDLVLIPLYIIAPGFSIIPVYVTFLNTAFFVESFLDKPWIPYKTLQDVINGPAKRTDPAFYNLSTRELEIADYLIDGLLHKDIAEKLSISASTVKSHAMKVYRKTGVENKEALRKLS